MFSLQAFWETCLMLIVVVIFLGIFLSAFLGALAGHSSNGKLFYRCFNWVFVPGVVVHEFAHYSMCRIFGVKVKEARWFKVGDFGIEGFVRTEDISSVITSLFLGLAPILVNGILVSLIYYFSPIYTDWDPLARFGITYLGISLALGTRPSKADLTLWWKVFNEYPGRGFFEFGELIIFGVVIYLMAFYQIEVWIILTVTFMIVVLFIIQARLRTGSQEVPKRWTYKK